MPKNSTTKDSSELLQIVTLTFAMTGGGFALLTLILKLFMSPGAEVEAKTAERNYGELVATLQQPQSKDLRANAKRGENQDNSDTLAEILKKAGDSNGVKFPVPQTTSTQKAGLEERKIKITTEGTKLQNLILFAAQVQDTKRTIQIEGASFKRDTRAKPDEESWIATVEFIDYVSK